MNSQAMHEPLTFYKATKLESHVNIVFCGNKTDLYIVISKIKNSSNVNWRL